MHSGLPHSILPFPLLRKNVKSWRFWSRHKAWVITTSPRTALSSAISDCIPNAALHPSLPPEAGASWGRKNWDVCLHGWWEGDISHMPFLAAVMQHTNCSLCSCTYCATNPCESSHHWTVSNCIRFETTRSNKESGFSEVLGFSVIINRCLAHQKFIFLFRNIVGCWFFYLAFKWITLFPKPYTPTAH